MLVLRTKMVVNGGITTLLITSYVYGYLFAFGEDINHTSGIDYFDLGAN
jgi:hypothetical protein